MTLKEFFSLEHNKFFWLNLLAMLLVTTGCIWGVLKGLDTYTHHGEAVLVPDAKGMTVSQAKEAFRNCGLACAISDSTYVKNLPAGSVLDHNPEAGQRVKQGRVIYLTINTLSIPLQVVPDVADNSSLRQAEARLLAAGFKLSEIEYIDGEKDWVYGVKYNGHSLRTGDQAPIGATLKLVVGDGGELIQDVDSLNVDSEVQIVSVRHTEPSASDESWF